MSEELEQHYAAYQAYLRALIQRALDHPEQFEEQFGGSLYNFLEKTADDLNEEFWEMGRQMFEAAGAQHDLDE